MFRLLWNSSRTWSSKMKSKTSAGSASSPAPSQTAVLLGCPVPHSAIRETCHTAPWQGICVETFVFLVLFVLSVDIPKSSLPRVSQDAFPSASFFQSTDFRCQISLQALFILDVHKIYSTVWWLLLTNVLLSLVPPGLSCLFPLWYVPIRLQPSDERGCPFFTYLETPPVHPQPEYFVSFCLCNRTSCSLDSFWLLYKCRCIVKLPSRVLGQHELWFMCSFTALTWWLCVHNPYGFLYLLRLYKPTPLHHPRRPADLRVLGPYQSSQGQLHCLQGASLP